MTVIFGAEFVTRACGQLNSHHADDVLAICRQVAGVREAVSAEAVDVDGDAVEVQVEAADGSARLRIAFLEPVTRPEEVRVAFTRLARHVRAARNTM